MNHRLHLALSALVLAAASACASSTTTSTVVSNSASATSIPSTDPVTTTAPSTSSRSTAAPAAATTAAGSTTGPAAAPTASASVAAPTASPPTSRTTFAPTSSPDGQAFSDPQGHYTVTVDPKWPAAEKLASAPEIEAWYVADLIDNFRPNVTVQTESVGALDVKAYLDAMLRNVSKYTLIDEHTSTGSSGRLLGILEYSGKTPAAAELTLHFLAVIDVNGGYAAVATFTSDEARFADLRSTIEPYLLSVAAH